MLMCGITKLLKRVYKSTYMIYHTNQNVFSNSTHEHKQYVNLLFASIWKCKHREWDRLIFAICFIIAGMITWFHTIYQINYTIILLPKWYKQIFCLNKSNYYWSILPLIDVLLIYY